VVHPTSHVAIPGEHYLEILRSLVADEVRTTSICADVADAVAEGRNSLVLTRWTEHLEAIAAALTERGVTTLVLRGGMGKKARRVVIDKLAEPGLRGAVLVATSGLIGEASTAPLSTPSSWPSQSGSKAASSNTSGASSGPFRASPRSSSTITSTPRSPYSPASTRSEPEGTPTLVSPPRSHQPAEGEEDAVRGLQDVT
jgi:hypothetical protein